MFPGKARLKCLGLGLKESKVLNIHPLTKKLKGTQDRLDKTEVMYSSNDEDSR